MKFFSHKDLNHRKHADALILPFWKDKQGVQYAGGVSYAFPSALDMALSAKDFKGKEGETLYIYIDGEPEKRFCLLGLGSIEKASVENLRRAYGGLSKSCLDKQLKSIHLVLPKHEKISEDELVLGIVEGLLLPNYTFQKYKHREPEEPEVVLLREVTLIGPQKRSVEIAEQVYKICKGVYLARDLINDNADEVTPQYLSQCAKDIASNYPSIKTTVFDKKRIEKEKMGLLLAVNRGSHLDPAFIIMDYKGNPHAKDNTVVIGKGVTYDTGGLNLKPTGGMETMKCDMAGAAACLGIILAVAELELKVNLTIVIPTTENGIDAKSFKPGDVYKSHSGKSVEMTNSDAEGRLILADALSYAAKHLHPARMIDLATLTGAIEVALGSEAAGIMSTNDDLAESLIQAGNTTYERLWRMPLYDEYKEKLKSEIADMKSWNGRPASSNVAATFLRYFVDDSIPWAHLDIAGTAYVSEAKKYLPKFATGYGVRLIVEFLRNLAIQQGKESEKPKKKSRSAAKKHS